MALPSISALRPTSTCDTKGVYGGVPAGLSSLRPTKQPSRAGLQSQMVDCTCISLISARGMLESVGISSSFCNAKLRSAICECANIVGDIGLAHEWKSLVDSFLLASSIGLVYLAGIICTRPPAASKADQYGQKQRKKTVMKSRDDLQIRGGVSEFGSGLTNQDISGNDEEEPRWKAAYHDTRLKLIEGFDAVHMLHDGKPLHHCELSLQALAEGPKLSLLIAALDWLHQKICNLKQRRDLMASDWTRMCLKILYDSVVPVFGDWIAGETEENFKTRMASVTVVPDTMGGPLLSEHMKNVLSALSATQSGEFFRSLKYNGKIEIYADYLYFACFSSARCDSRCNLRTLNEHGCNILEDLIIAIADGAAELYMEILSADDGSWDSQMSNVMRPEIFSTRSLERFRNEVALHGWLNENFRSVTAIFEDRMDMWVIKNFKADGTSTDSKLVACSLDHSSLPVRRIKELKALSGWKYYYSIYLEFSDVFGPVLRTIVTKLGEGISFLLVILIGRSLGLIYRGIRQSIQWTSK